MVQLVAVRDTRVPQRWFPLGGSTIHLGLFRQLYVWFLRTSELRRFGSGWFRARIRTKQRRPYSHQFTKGKISMSCKMSGDSVYFVCSGEEQKSGTLEESEFSTLTQNTPQCSGCSLQCWYAEPCFVLPLAQNQWRYSGIVYLFH